MPLYDYLCEANSRKVEVSHPVEATLKTWGELCFVAQIPLGNTDPAAPVKKVISVPNISVPIADSRLKELGFTKLIRRDQGVFENVTALDHEKRYFKEGDPSSMPDLKKRIED